jgi:ribonuclease HI
MNQPVLIYTEGGCRGNSGADGGGAVLLWGTDRKELNGSVTLTTNNRMELLAAIEGLKFLNRDVAVRL